MITRPRYLLINTGLLSGGCLDIYSENYNPTDRPDYRALAKLGMLTVTPVVRAWQVDFTDAGKRAVEGKAYAHTEKPNCDEWQSSLPVAVFDGVEVTGIQQEGIHARADFAIKWKLTPLGLALKTIPEGNEEMGLGPEFLRLPKGEGEFSENYVGQFERYDDGWRLKVPE